MEQNVSETTTDLISLEELQEMEYNIVYNPFDVTGNGYLADDFTDYLMSEIQKLREHYDNINPSSKN